MNRVRSMPTVIRRLVLAGAIGATATVGASTLVTAPAHAFACPYRGIPCPPPVPPKVGEPTVEFGCGTVTVSSGDVSVTAAILPCPGPVIV